MKTQKPLNLYAVALAVSVSLVCSGAFAKLPAPSEEAKAKAEEAKLKAAEGAKKESELLAKYQDLNATKYAARLKSEGKEFKPTPIAAPVVVSAAAPTAVPLPVAAASATPVQPKK